MSLFLPPLPPNVGMTTKLNQSEISTINQEIQNRNQMELEKDLVRLEILKHVLTNNLIWKIHPWVLTEISHHFISFFRAFVSHLIQRLCEIIYANELNLKEQEDHLEYVFLRFAYLISRSSRLAFSVREILREFQNSVHFKPYLNYWIQRLPQD